MPAKRIPLEGQTFGIVEVAEYVGTNEHRNAMYRIRCLCGEERIVRGSDLTSCAIRRCSVDCKYEPAKFRAVFTVVKDGGRSYGNHE